MEQFYVNYAGGDVEGIGFQRQKSPLPEDEQEALQQKIVAQFNIKEPEQHFSWISKNSLGPVFVYRTDRGTLSKLYPAMTVSIQNNSYTVGTSKPANKASIHYFTLGDNGTQIDYINKQSYSSEDLESKDKVNTALNKMIAAIGGGTQIAIQTQVLYSDTSFLKGTYPEIVAEEPVKEFTLLA